MDPNNIDDQNESPSKDRNEDEEFVPGQQDDPSEANDDNEPIEDPQDEEDEDIQKGID